jgi:outer membrane protein, heavy metal efflux system
MMSPRLVAMTFALGLLCMAGAVRAGDSELSPQGPPLADDPLLAGLVRDALSNRPELAQTRAMIEAERERIPQSGALPDPVVTAGIQNDGFRSIQIGDMETSWLLFMGSQTFPWAGKRGLRGEVTTLATQGAEADLARAELSTQADVERAYVDLLLVRDELRLLARIETLWTQAEGMARVRYETGDGAQSDLLRAQLERSRLKQRRWGLEAEEQRRVAALNRLRGRAPEDSIATSRSIADVPDPVLADTAAVAAAESKSPELRKSQLAIEQSAKLVDLAEKDYYPDLTVSAGVMPRWGDFETMWQANVSFSIPLWSGSKQSHAVTENELRGTAAARGTEAVRQLLRERLLERRALLEALIETNRLYRSGLLVQSEATVTSTTAQYRVGRIAFASVLEAITGYIADTDAFYQSVAATQRLDIAQRELSLEPAAGAGSAVTAGAPMPGTGVSIQSAAPAASASGPAPSTGSGSMTGM